MDISKHGWVIQMLFPKEFKQNNVLIKNLTLASRVDRKGYLYGSKAFQHEDMMRMGHVCVSTIWETLTAKPGFHDESPGIKQSFDAI